MPRAVDMLWTEPALRAMQQHQKHTGGRKWRMLLGRNNAPLGPQEVKEAIRKRERVTSSAPHTRGCLGD